MPKFWQTEEFKRLSNEWEEKLKNSDFVDIEKEINGEKSLIQFSKSNIPRTSYRRSSRLFIESRVDYISLVEFYMDYNPPTERIARFIMCLLSEGLKIIEICNELKNIGGPCHRQTVRYIIRKYEQIWGIRSWSEEKLNPKWRTTHIKL